MNTQKQQFRKFFRHFYVNLLKRLHFLCKKAVPLRLKIIFTLFYVEQ